MFAQIIFEVSKNASILLPEPSIQTAGNSSMPWIVAGILIGGPVKLFVFVKIEIHEKKFTEDL